VLRGHGRRQHRALLPTTIRRYVDHVLPVLLDWSESVDSLREITRAHVHDALAATSGYARAQLQVTLRSLFGALQQERLIFHDNARGMALPYPRRLPVPLPSDRLHGLIDKTPTHAGKLAVALVAIHALPGADIRRLRLDDLDRHHGRLTVARPGRPHIVYLDEFTLNLATAWLTERAQRWPRTTNPHLLITQQSATDHRNRPMHAVSFRMLFTPLGITPSQLRIDRIYDEARHTADPVHLMRTFGISTNTAMTYLEATHPERARPDPTQA
jgi:integrase